MLASCVTGTHMQVYQNKTENCSHQLLWCLFCARHGSRWCLLPLFKTTGNDASRDLISIEATCVEASDGRVTDTWSPVGYKNNLCVNISTVRVISRYYCIYRSWLFYAEGVVVVWQLMLPSIRLLFEVHFNICMRDTNGHFPTGNQLSHNRLVSSP